MNQVEELQTAVGVFLRDRDHQTQVGFNHFLLRATGTGFAHAHFAVDLLDLGDGEPGRFFYVSDLTLQALDFVFVLSDLGADILLARDAAEPAAVAL